VNVVAITLLDHVGVGNGRHFSFTDQNLLSQRESTLRGSLFVCVLHFGLASMA
jgi:hypothetical protein